jgi:hypothetical protein
MEKLHNEELNDLYFSPNIIGVISKSIKKGGLCSTCGGKERCLQGFGKKT